MLCLQLVWRRKKEKKEKWSGAFSTELEAENAFLTLKLLGAIKG
jgi:hypothetical protein